MEKINPKTEYKEMYSAKKKPEMVKIPSMNYIMVNGEGDTKKKSFENAGELLQTVAKEIKKAAKEKDELDFTVPPVEALIWADDMTALDSKKRAKEWMWSVMLAMPKGVKKGHYTAALKALEEKVSASDLEQVVWDKYNEGKAAAIMHVGTYQKQKSTLADLMAYIEEEGMAPSGKHHEVYLNDPKKVEPEKQKVIIRYAVAKK